MTGADSDRLAEMIRERDRAAALLETLERRIAECLDPSAAIADAEERRDVLAAARLRGNRISGRAPAPERLAARYSINR